VAHPTAPRRRKRSANFAEIAKLAGVSASTVDRVLNERGSVSTAARERVVAAVRELAFLWGGDCRQGSRGVLRLLDPDGCPVRFGSQPTSEKTDAVSVRTNEGGALWSL
jgi:hypothetical protein